SAARSHRYPPADTSQGAGDGLTRSLAVEGDQRNRLRRGVLIRVLHVTDNRIDVGCLVEVFPTRCGSPCSAPVDPGHLLDVAAAVDGDSADLVSQQQTTLCIDALSDPPTIPTGEPDRLAAQPVDG